MKFAEYAKMYAALVGSILTSLSAATSVLPAGAKPWVSLALAIATAVATWAIPNKDAGADPPPPAWPSAGPAWDEPVDHLEVPSTDPEPPKSLYLIAA